LWLKHLLKVLKEEKGAAQIATLLIGLVIVLAIGGFIVYNILTPTVTNVHENVLERAAEITSSGY